MRAGRLKKMMIRWETGLWIVLALLCLVPPAVVAADELDKVIIRTVGCAEERSASIKRPGIPD